MQTRAAPLSNPFAHSKKQNVFNTPFAANTLSTAPDNQWSEPGYYPNGGTQQDEGDDFNFVADPVPAGDDAPGHQEFTLGMQREEQYQEPVRQQAFQPVNNVRRAPIPQQRPAPPVGRGPAMVPQHQQQYQQAHNQFGEDEMVSLEEIQLDQQYTQNMQKQRSAPQPRGGNQYAKTFSQPFPQQQIPEQQPRLQQQRSDMSLGASDEDEIPLLEDLGIEMDKIKQKFQSILTQRGIKDIAYYDDMAGPLLVCVMFGIFLLFRGKVHFGSIYGFGLTGCVGIYLIINLMSKQNQYVELYKTISILGYSLLPFTFLALLAVFADLEGLVGGAISLAMIIWSTVTATRFFEYGLDMEDKKYLIAYPISLFYFVFMLLTVF